MQLRFNHTFGVIACMLLMAIILFFAPYSDHIQFIEDQGVTWYFWKRPDPDMYSQLMAWGGFAAHQLAIWWCIFLGQTSTPAYGNSLHKFNLYALGANAFFVLFHIFQTKLTYDGLAQDVHVFSSQFAVIILLVLVLMLENDRRGIAFGKPVPLISRMRDTIRRYHGYYFSWAIIYTFWFHPIETTLGHLLGTFYTLLLLLQGSLFFTRFHTHRWWTVFLETFVLIHGAMVAYLSTQGGTPEMFAFGFLVVFFVTQIYGLGLSRKWISLAQLGFVIAMVIYYVDDLAVAGEIFRVPGGLYLGVVILTAIGALLMLLAKIFSRSSHR